MFGWCCFLHLLWCPIQIKLCLYAKICYMLRISLAHTSSWWFHTEFCLINHILQCQHKQMLFRRQRPGLRGNAEPIFTRGSSLRDWLFDLHQGLDLLRQQRRPRRSCLCRLVASVLQYVHTCLYLIHFFNGLCSKAKLSEYHHFVPGYEG